MTATAEDMPLPPTAVRLGAGGNFLLGLGRYERELAAGRFVRACREAGGWAGISYKQLSMSMHEEYQAWLTWRNVRQAHRDYHDALMQYKRKLLRRKLANVFTLGLYGLFVKQGFQSPEPPPTPMYEEPRNGFGLHSSHELHEGLHELVQLGALRLEKIEGDPDDVILYATPRLVQGMLH